MPRDRAPDRDKDLTARFEEAFRAIRTSALTARLVRVGGVLEGRADRERRDD